MCIYEHVFPSSVHCKKQETKIPLQHEQSSVHAPWSTVIISIIKKPRLILEQGKDNPEGLRWSSAGREPATHT